MGGLFTVNLTSVLTNNGYVHIIIANYSYMCILNTLLIIHKVHKCDVQHVDLRYRKIYIRG